jgi:hypothetical protein
VLGVVCRGVGAMELVAMDMKLRGMYIARQLSFKGVSFRIEEIPIDPSFRKLYDDSAMLVSIRHFSRQYKLSVLLHIRGSTDNVFI